MRVLFVFFWGSKMERVELRSVMKSLERGGCGFLDIPAFLSMHYWLVHYKAFIGGGKTAAIMRYLVGWALIKWGWCSKDQ